MAFISVFDVLGPNMIGPSSSHTAGAAVMANLARRLLGGRIVKVKFTLYGSFAKTGRGHGTDRALLGGMMGFEPDSIRIRTSYEAAREQGLEYEFEYADDDGDADMHPNTADMCMQNDRGQSMTVRGESLGGGKVRICAINGVKVEFTGEYPTVIVIYPDRPGIAAHITHCMNDCGVNIAFLRIFREAKGGMAYSIVESDDHLPDDLAAKIYRNKYIESVMIIQDEERA